MYAHDNFLNIVELWYQDIFSPRISKEKILAKNANEGRDKKHFFTHGLENHDMYYAYIINVYVYYIYHPWNRLVIEEMVIIIIAMLWFTKNGV